METVTFSIMYIMIFRICHEKKNPYYLPQIKGEKRIQWDLRGEISNFLNKLLQESPTLTSHNNSNSSLLYLESLRTMGSS